MIYLDNFILPGERAEDNVIYDENRTCFNTFYPFKIFPQKALDEVQMDTITVFYGGNGSGKSTLINVIAAKLNATRYSDFNHAPLFRQFVDLCHTEFNRRPPAAYVLSSDDVFDYVLNARSVNGNIDDKRNALFKKYRDTHIRALNDKTVYNLKGLNDYKNWRENMDILGGSMSGYVRDRVAPDVDLYSNGETAMRYFLDRIEKDAVYFLDEPENSLSVQFQIELADYIVATARATRSQFIIATHSPILLAMKDALIYNLDEYPVDTCNWTELPNVRRYFDFFMDHADEF
ncbi:MAG: AAA family ATPase [Clostridia bacterium]|nr:AAA family ATPase [Clostridia bacterium]